MKRGIVPESPIETNETPAWAGVQKHTALKVASAYLSPRIVVRERATPKKGVRRLIR